MADPPTASTTTFRSEMQNVTLKKQSARRICVFGPGVTLHQNSRSSPNGPTLYTHRGIPAHYYFFGRARGRRGACAPTEPEAVTAALPSVCQTPLCSVWFVD